MGEALTQEHFIDTETKLASVEILREMARPHVEASNGKLILLPADPNNYPAQRVSHLTGSPIDTEYIPGVAEQAAAVFPALHKEMHTNHEDTLDEAAEVLRNGGNVINATNHSSLIDIALAQAASYVELKKRDVDFTSAMLIGKMISVVEFDVGGGHVVAADALKWLCDDIYLSFPKTRSVQESRLASEFNWLIKRNNAAVMHKLTQQLALGRVLLGVAASGTVDKYDEETGNHVMGRVADGTCDILCTPNTYTIPTAVYAEEVSPVLQPVHGPRQLHHADEVHDMMPTIARTLNQRVPGKNYVYSA
jgi:hypothetical protein